MKSYYRTWRTGIPIMSMLWKNEMPSGEVRLKMRGSGRRKLRA